MEVFLQAETKDFIELLFSTLETKNYLKEAASQSSKPVRQPKPNHVVTSQK
jgi:hypothetical protein